MVGFVVLDVFGLPLEMVNYNRIFCITIWIKMMLKAGYSIRL